MSEREQVARQARALGERERLVEQRDRRRDARELVAADRRGGRARRRDRDPRSRRALDDLPRALQQLDRLRTWPTSCSAHASPASSAHLERSSRVPSTLGAAIARYASIGVLVLLRCGQRLGAVERRLDASRARPSRRPDERRTGSTPSRSASHSTVASVGRVLPRSIWLMYSFEKRVAGELGLRQTRGDAERADALAEASARVDGAGGVAVSCMPTSVNPDRAPLALPLRGMCGYRFRVK